MLLLPGYDYLHGNKTPSAEIGKKDPDCGLWRVYVNQLPQRQELCKFSVYSLPTWPTNTRVIFCLCPCSYALWRRNVCMYRALPEAPTGSVSVCVMCLLWWDETHHWEEGIKENTKELLIRGSVPARLGRVSSILLSIHPSFPLGGWVGAVTHSHSILILADCFCVLTLISPLAAAASD